jgi:arylsulfatase A-like enzyme
VRALLASLALLLVAALWAGQTRTLAADGGAAGAVGTAGRVSEQVRPNVVVIMTDDMRNDDLRYMPYTRSLIRAEGVRFRNSFAPYPLCCPARASVLTGRYAHNHRVFDVVAPYAFSSFDDSSTLATWLRSSGYATIYLGKYLNGYGSMPEPGRTTGNSLTYVPPGWTSWRASPDGGFPSGSPYAGSTYEFFDTTLSRNGKGFAPYQGRYQTRVLGELSEGIIRYRAASDRPFFLYVSYVAPHHGSPREPDDPAPVRRNDGRYTTFLTTARPDDVKGSFDATVRAAPGASWADPDFSDKPGYLVKPRINTAERAAMLEVTRQRVEALSVVDGQVRRTIRALADSGELDDTLVVFTSDNGYFLGEQRMRQGKIWPHEPSLRVPLVMRGPGIPAGQVRTDPFTSIDLAPTIAEIAGVEPGLEPDGVSLLQVAREGDQGWRRGVLTETGTQGNAKRTTDEAGQPLAPGEAPDPRFALGIRTSRYLYVDLATGEHELYDVVRDPRQYVNLAGRPAYASRMALFAERLRTLRTCQAETCRTPLPPELSTAP